MKRIAKYWAIFRTQLLNSLAYPAELIWRSMMILLFMWVFSYLWRVTFDKSATGIIAGLSLKDTLWYLMLTETIELSRPRFARLVAEAVKDGSIVYLLSKPYDFILYQLSFSAGDSIFRILLTALFGSALIWWMVGPPPDPLGWPLALIAMAAAWLINFCITALIGLTAFVTEEVAPFEWIYQKLAFVLGGMLIPIDFYPDWLQRIAHSLPFAYMMYVPARLFVTPDLQRFFSLLGLQIIWILVLGAAVALVYRRSILRLSINGG